MACLNRRSGPPEQVTEIWTGAVPGANTSLVETYSHMAARAVVVTVLGDLTLLDIGGTTHTFSAADMVAAGYILRGQWIQANVAGATAHTLKIWW